MLLKRGAGFGKTWSSWWYFSDNDIKEGEASLFLVTTFEGWLGVSTVGIFSARQQST